MNETSKILTGVVMRLMRPSTLLQRLILGNKQPTFSGNGEIEVQFYKGRRRLAPATTPRFGGVIQHHTGFSKTTFTAPLFGPMWDLTEAASTIAPGEMEMVGADGNIQTTSTADRMNIWKGLRLQEGVDQIIRRKEWMLAQQLTTGKILLRGKEGYKLDIDLGWMNGISVTVPWDDAAGDPFGDINAIRMSAIDAGVPTPNVMVLGTTAAAAFIANAAVKTALQRTIGYVNPLFDLRGMDAQGVQRIGYIQELDLEVYVYGAKYEDEENNNALTPFIPAGSGVLFPSADINTGQIAYGAIYDARDKSWYNGEYYVREYTSDNGHAEFLELDSKPVCCLADSEEYWALNGLTSEY